MKSLDKRLLELSDSEKIAALKLLKEPIEQRKKTPIDFSGNHIKIGVLSDTHYNCKWVREDLIKLAYDKFSKEKVDLAVHCGDLDDGENMHPGHVYELTSHGFDEHKKKIINDYPSAKFKTYIIAGNHDESFIKQAGADIVKSIAQERNDFIYLGQREADLKIKDVTIRLSHPGKGSAYAISYTSQKYAESISGGKKPNIAYIGHFHKMEHLFYRNIHLIQTGTMCEQTPWMRSKSLSAHLGFRIDDIYFKKDGTIDCFKQQFYPFYD